MSVTSTVLTALQGITANKLRATLTALGIIIGVASVIATVALGNGARASVEAEFRFLGSDQVQISARQALEDGQLVPFGQPLTYEDGLLMPGSVELVDQVDMSVTGDAKVRHDRATLDIAITGLTANALLTAVAMKDVQPLGWPEGQPMNAEAFIGSGRFFSAGEVLADADVCVLGHRTAEDLFGSDDPVGDVIWVNRRRCLVIGTLVELEPTDPRERYRSKPNDGVYLPIGAAIGNLFDREVSVDISARITDDRRMGEARSQITAYLRDRHGIERSSSGEFEDDFHLTTKQDIL